MLGAIISGVSGLIGARKAEKAASKQSALEYQRQKEFAQSGISWKVKDAKRAGIAPLAALGSNLVSYAPQSISAGDGGISNFGQDIGRAIDATRSPGGRVDAFTRTAQALELERGGLQNELLRAQIAKLNQAGHGPGIAVDSENYTIPGQPNSGLLGMEVQPSRTVVTTANRAFEQLGSVPDVHYADTPRAGQFPIPSSAVKQQIEDMIVPELMWSIRNNILPMFSKAYQTPPKDPNMAWDEEWYFHPIDGYKKRKVKWGNTSTRRSKPNWRYR